MLRWRSFANSSSFAIQRRFFVAVSTNGFDRSAGGVRAHRGGELRGHRGEEAAQDALHGLPHRAPGAADPGHGEGDSAPSSYSVRLVKETC